MWMPRLMVSVAKTTLTSPRSKRISVKRFSAGRIPAWCIPAPWRSPAKSSAFTSRLGHDARIIPQRVGDRLVHLGSPLRRQERVAVLQVPSQRALASRSAEDEIDGREPLPLAKLRDDPVRAGGPTALPVAAEGTPGRGAEPRGRIRSRGAGAAGRDAGPSSVAISPSGWQRRYVKRDRPHRVDDGVDGPVDLADPGGDLVRGC